MSVKRVPVLICDVCGDQLLDIHPQTSTLRQARIEAAERGWTSRRVNGTTHDDCGSHADRGARSAGHAG